ncbi:hypothetical protein L3X38_025262 [Prunus dulcis]|uniref:Aminoacyl-tRNA synthetase class II (D/K/N) domain-containing protein n=1 Tax=Prunus dulcis TaxID=3755 RepID=A0AAD4W1A8_PRUDU|nr:hypothetical protein L3X38_025262 [Prunus dulcis]
MYVYVFIFHFQVGELIGGGQREERFDDLHNRILERGLPVEPYQSYLDLPRFETVKHSDFGLGYERMVMLAKDCIPKKYARFVEPSTLYVIKS